MCKIEELSIQNLILLTSYYHEMAYQRVISLFPVIYYSYIIVYSVHWSKNPSIDSLGKYDKIVSNAKLMIVNKVKNMVGVKYFGTYT